MTTSRQDRDWKDTCTIAKFLTVWNPFQYDGNLCNIANGVHAHSSVNTVSAKEVGKKILEKMDGMTPEAFTFKRGGQAVTMASKNSDKIDGEKVHVDPCFYFNG